VEEADVIFQKNQQISYLEGLQQTTKKSITLTTTSGLIAT